MPSKLCQHAQIQQDRIFRALCLFLRCQETSGQIFKCTFIVDKLSTPPSTSGTPPPSNNPPPSGSNNGGGGSSSGSGGSGSGSGGGYGPSQPTTVS